MCRQQNYEIRRTAHGVCLLLFAKRYRLQELCSFYPAGFAMRIALIFTLGLCLLSGAPAAGRLWRDAGGSKKFEAEFVTVEGDKVRLNKLDGKTVDIAFDKLHPADAQYARELAADQGIEVEGQARQAEKVKTRTYAELEKLATRQTSAANALRAYELFLADRTIAAEEKKLASERLPHWQKLADDKMVKLGAKWVKEDTVKLLATHESRLIGEAIEIAMKNDYKQAADKLAAAAKLNPASGRPMFIQGLVNALGLRNPQAAEKNFSECVRRWAPTAADNSETKNNHAAALNNLAITQVRQRNFDAALRNWKQASTVLPGTAEIAQNLGRLLHLSEKTKFMPLPRANQKSATDLFASTMAASQTHAFDERVGWLYMQLAGSAPRFELPKRDPARATLPGIDRNANAGNPRIEPGAASVLKRPTVPTGGRSTRLEDCYCMLCNGDSQTDCPVRNCARGRVPVQKTEVISRNPVSGEPMTRTRTVRVPCTTCKGEGKVKCTVCREGIDPALPGGR